MMGRRSSHRHRIRANGGILSPYVELYAHTMAYEGTCVQVYNTDRACTGKVMTDVIVVVVVVLWLIIVGM